MATHTFDPAGHFYNQVATLSIAVVTQHALSNLQLVRRQIDHAMRTGQLSRARFEQALKEGSPIELDLTTGLAPKIEFGGRIVGAVLHDADRLGREIGVRPVGPLVFSEGPAQPDTSGTVRSPASPRDYMAAVAQVCLASAFESVQARLVSVYGSKGSWPPLWQYFRHLRNAASHGNRFCITPTKHGPAIDSANPPQWRSSVMPNDAAMHDKSLFLSFLSLGDLPVLLADLASQLATDGITP